METLHKLENTAGGWFKGAPHLPVNARKWLADNVWWIVIVGVVLAAFGLAALLPVLFGASVLTSSLAAYAGVDTARVMLAAWVGVAFLAAVVVVELMAVTPLKEKKKAGWDYLFLALLLSIVSSVVGLVITYDFSNVIGAVLTALIGGYFLFEIRGHFTGSKR